jgi:thiamine biosynthesis lipoprotein
MKETRHIMGMPVTLIAADVSIHPDAFKKTFDFFSQIDQTYSPYIITSDVSKINNGLLQPSEYSKELQEILALAKITKKQTQGYFDVWHDNVFDPSGIVKGWAIGKAAKILGTYTNDYYVEAGGDIQVSGNSSMGKPWNIGIRNPFERDQNISIISLKGYAVATSGTAIRGQHIYNPHNNMPIQDVVSVSVIGPKIVDADRYATAAFAMGGKGASFIESLKGFEAYIVTKDKLAIRTSGWYIYEQAAV